MEDQITIQERYVWYNRKPNISKRAFIVEYVIGGRKSIEEVANYFHVCPQFVLKCLQEYYQPATRNMILISSV